MLRRRSSQIPIRISTSEDIPDIVVTNAPESARKSRSKIPRPPTSARATSETRKQCNLLERQSYLKRSKSTLDKAYQNKNIIETPKISSIRTLRNPPGSSVKKNFDCQYSKLINDKHWQQAQSQRIHNFISQLTKGEGPQSGLRPLTINMFVFVCNLLFSQINSKFKITMNNYVEELPVIMEMLHYPLSLKKTLLTAVNIPRNFGTVLAIFDWLINIIQANNAFTLDDDLLKRRIGELDHISDAYTEWLETGSLDHVKDKFYLYYNRQYLKEEDLEKSIMNLKQTLKEKEFEIENLKNKEDILNKEQQPYLEIADKIKLCETEIEKCNHSKKEIENIVKSRENYLSTFERMYNDLRQDKDKLQKQYDLQSISKDQYELLVNNCISLEQQIQSINSMIEHFDTNICNDTEKLEKLKSDIFALSNEYNNTCLDIKILNEYTVSNLSDPNVAINVLNSFKKRIENCLEEKSTTIKNIKKEIDERQQHIINYEQKYLQITVEEKKIDKLNEEIELLKKRCQDALQKQVKKLEEKKKLEEEFNKSTIAIDNIKTEEKIVLKESAEKIDTINKSIIQFMKEANNNLRLLENQLKQDLLPLQAILEKLNDNTK